MLNLLSYDFMQRAFLAVIAMSLFSPVLGTFLILRRQSLMSDTLSHVSLSGVAVGLVLGISPTISTIVIVLTNGHNRTKKVLVQTHRARALTLTHDNK